MNSPLPPSALSLSSEIEFLSPKAVSSSDGSFRASFSDFAGDFSQLQPIMQASSDSIKASSRKFFSHVVLAPALDGVKKKAVDQRKTSISLPLETSKIADGNLSFRRSQTHAQVNSSNVVGSTYASSPNLELMRRSSVEVENPVLKYNIPQSPQVVGFKSSAISTPNRRFTSVEIGSMGSNLDLLHLTKKLKSESDDLDWADEVDDKLSLNVSKFVLPIKNGKGSGAAGKDMGVVGQISSSLVKFAYESPLGQFPERSSSAADNPFALAASRRKISMQSNTPVTPNGFAVAAQSRSVAKSVSSIQSVSTGPAMTQSPSIVPKLLNRAPLLVSKQVISPITSAVASNANVVGTRASPKIFRENDGISQRQVSLTASSIGPTRSPNVSKSSLQSDPVLNSSKFLIRRNLEDYNEFSLIEEEEAVCSYCFFSCKQHNAMIKKATPIVKTPF